MILAYIDAASGSMLLQIILGGTEGKIAHKQFTIHFLSLDPLPLRTVPAHRVSNHH